MRKQYVLLFLLCTQLGTLLAQNSTLLQKAYSKEADEWAKREMSTMTLKEKIGQLFIYTITPRDNKKTRSLLRHLTKKRHIGGLLFSEGGLQEYVDLINFTQSMAKVPILVTFDGEWGLSMRIKDTPDFPKNSALGCIQGDQLIYNYGKEVGRELRHIGVQVDFAPIADLHTNPFNPVISYRSFGDNRERVAKKVVAYAKGLESEGVLAVCKHFPGHGNTRTDSHKELPRLDFSYQRLDSIELYPFKEAIQHEVGGIMMGHLLVSSLDKQLPASLSPAITTHLLKDTLHYKGLVFTDALVMKGLKGFKEPSLKALMAGNDLLLCTPEVKKEIRSILSAIRHKIISASLIENKCHKVLCFKYALQLHKQEPIQLKGLAQKLATTKTEQLTKALRMESITLLADQKSHPKALKEGDTLSLISLGPLQADSTFIRCLKQHTTVKHYAIENNSCSTIQELKGVDTTHPIVISITTEKLGAFKKVLSRIPKGKRVYYTVFNRLTALHKIAYQLQKPAVLILGHATNEDIQMYVAGVLFGKNSCNGRLSSKIISRFKEGDGIDCLQTSVPATSNTSYSK